MVGLEGQHDYVGGQPAAGHRVIRDPFRARGRGTGFAGRQPGEYLGAGPPAAGRPGLGELRVEQRVQGHGAGPDLPGQQGPLQRDHLGHGLVVRRHPAMMTGYPFAGRPWRWLRWPRAGHEAADR
jgi:hypothetical protein